MDVAGNGEKVASENAGRPRNRDRLGHDAGLHDKNGRGEAGEMLVAQLHRFVGKRRAGGEGAEKEARLRRLRHEGTA